VLELDASAPAAAGVDDGESDPMLAGDGLRPPSLAESRAAER